MMKAELLALQVEFLQGANPTEEEALAVAARVRYETGGEDTTEGGGESPAQCARNSKLFK